MTAAARPVTVVAIGGGGFTHGTEPGQEEFCLARTVPRPAVGYVGAANGDDPGRIERFHDRFRGRAARASHLAMAADAAEARRWLAGLDLLYVGGGDPAALLEHWRHRGIDRAMLAAARAGLVLAGVSAGAMCWFAACLWRDGTGGLRHMAGLGLVGGAMTPHCTIEPERRAAMGALVASGALPPGFALEDGAALLLRDGRPAALHPGEDGTARAFRIASDGQGGWRETPLDPVAPKG